MFLYVNALMAYHRFISHYTLLCIVVSTLKLKLIRISIVCSLQSIVFPDFLATFLLSVPVLITNVYAVISVARINLNKVNALQRSQLSVNCF